MADREEVQHHRSHSSGTGCSQTMDTVPDHETGIYVPFRNGQTSFGGHFAGATVLSAHKRTPPQQPNHRFEELQPTNACITIFRVVSTPIESTMVDIA